MCTPAPERPAARPMIPPGCVGSRSTIEVIHGSELRQVAVCSMPSWIHRTPRARIRCTVHQAMPRSFATSRTARFVVVTAVLTFTFNLVVTRARAGS